MSLSLGFYYYFEKFVYSEFVIWQFGYGAWQLLSLNSGLPTDCMTTNFYWSNRVAFDRIFLDQHFLGLSFVIQKKVKNYKIVHSFRSMNSKYIIII